MSTNLNNQAAPADNPALQAQLAAAYPPTPTPSVKPDSETLKQLPPDIALQQLHQDPVKFVQQVVNAAAIDHLQRLKEEAELQGALNAFRRVHPDAQRFEPFILQEVARLLQSDSGYAAMPWDALLEKGLAVFREKFKATLTANPDMKNQANNGNKNGAQMEGVGNRKLPSAAPAFTRNQIANMSLPEFIAQEQAINDALKNNRIR